MTAYGLGGKQTIGKEIAAVLSHFVPESGQYWEPFVGMASVLKSMDFVPTRMASDLQHEVIAMWKDLQNGWIPPASLTESQYNAIKHDYNAPAGLRAYVGFGFSFGGNYFSSFKCKYSEYDKGAGGRAFRGVMNTLPLVKDVHFFAASYDEVKVPKSPSMLIYCDPPYEGTSGKVGNSNQRFDSDKFWKWVREQSKYHTVIVSETKAPPDFVTIWEKPRHLKISVKAAKQRHMTEKLFIHKKLWF